MVKDNFQNILDYALQKGISSPEELDALQTNWGEISGADKVVASPYRPPEAPISKAKQAVQMLDDANAERNLPEMVQEPLDKRMTKNTPADEYRPNVAKRSEELATHRTKLENYANLKQQEAELAKKSAERVSKLEDLHHAFGTAEASAAESVAPAVEKSAPSILSKVGSGIKNVGANILKAAPRVAGDLVKGAAVGMALDPNEAGTRSEDDEMIANYVPSLERLEAIKRELTKKPEVLQSIGTPDYSTQTIASTPVVKSVAQAPKETIPPVTPPAPAIAEAKPAATPIAPIAPEATPVDSEMQQYMDARKAATNERLMAGLAQGADTFANAIARTKRDPAVAEYWKQQEAKSNAPVEQYKEMRTLREASKAKEQEKQTAKLLAQSIIKNNPDLDPKTLAGMTTKDLVALNTQFDKERKFGLDEKKFNATENNRKEILDLRKQELDARKNHDSILADKLGKQVASREEAIKFSKNKHESDIVMKHGKDLDLTNQGARSGIAKAYDQMRLARNVLAFMGNPENVNPQAVTEMASGVLTVINQGRQAGQSTLEKFIPKTVGMNAANIQQWITNKPQDAHVRAFLDQYRRTLLTESNTARAVVAEHVDSALGKLEVDRKLYPETIRNLVIKHDYIPTDLLVKHGFLKETKPEQDIVNNKIARDSYTFKDNYFRARNAFMDAGKNLTEEEFIDMLRKKTNNPNLEVIR